MKTTTFPFLAVHGFTVAALVSAAGVQAADWQQYRGPNTDGTSSEKILKSWPAGGPRQVWKAPMSDGFSSFAVAFDGPADMDEEQFERALWRRLAALQRIDALCYDWSPEVSRDPASPRFGFSLGGLAFFIVGLHPDASRTARRFAHPAIIFNPHEQFEILRAKGRYQGLKDAIRKRDGALDGFPNPMLAEHGTKSEAPQYSGRLVGPDWRCPFRPE